MSTLSYETLLEQGHAIAKLYALDPMLNGLTPELINILLTNHIEKIKAANNYDATTNLINAGLSSHLGMAINVSDFITVAEDCVKLYEIFAAWRSKLLASMDVQAPHIKDRAVDQV